EEDEPGQLQPLAVLQRGLLPQHELFASDLERDRQRDRRGGVRIPRRRLRRTLRDGFRSASACRVTHARSSAGVAAPSRGSAGASNPQLLGAYASPVECACTLAARALPLALRSPRSDSQKLILRMTNRGSQRMTSITRAQMPGV